MKLCCHCKHVRNLNATCSWSVPLCASPDQGEVAIDMVGGGLRFVPAHVARNEEDRCGKEARWFQALPRV